MCVSPIKIPNPNFGNLTGIIQRTKDTIHRYMYVPCGVCDECLMKRQVDLVQRARCMSLDHYIFFCTLTYNNASLPSLVTSTGYRITYVDSLDIQRMFKRIRHDNSFGRPFKYYFVSERGGEKHRPHVHGLIFIPKSSDDDPLFTSSLERKVRGVMFHEWRRNYGSDRSPDWRPLFTYRSKIVAGRIYRNFDCHYVVPHSSEQGSDDVAFYVTKYVLKPSKFEKRLRSALALNLPIDEFLEVWQIVRSRSYCSKGFGGYTDLEKSYVRSCIERSQDDPDGLKYFASNGSPSPLSRYYRRFVSPDAAIRSVDARGGPVSDEVRDIAEILSDVERDARIMARVSQNDLHDFIPDDL